MLKNGQTYFKNLAVFIPQDFLSMFDHFSTLDMKQGVKDQPFRHHTGSSHVICRVNQWTVFCMMVVPGFNTSRAKQYGE